MWEKPLTKLKGIGEKRAAQYEKLGVHTIGELLRFYPRDYIDYTAPVPIAQTQIGEYAVIKGYVKRKFPPQLIRRGMELFKFIFSDEQSDILITLFNTSYTFDKFKTGEEYILYGKVAGNVYRREMASPQFISAHAPAKLQPIYHLTEGITQPILHRNMKAALAVLEEDLRDPLPESLKQEQGLCHLRYALQNIHFPADREAYELARRRLVFEELLVLQLGLLLLRGRSRALAGAIMKAKDISAFHQSLPFTLTQAQQRAIDDCMADLCREHPMNRLLQGDVGSGKTAVAAALCYFAHLNGHQVALMAPTEILATQHYHTLKRFLEPLGVPCALLTGSVSPKQKKALKERIKAGEIAVVVGTHALIQGSTEFLSLALVITDEQHRFGVRHRAQLAEKGVNPHALVMSATPIPRTLALIIYGDLDISILDEMPVGRIAIETYAVDSGKRARIYAFIRKHIEQGRQAYIVCPAIEESEAGLTSAERYAAQLAKNEFADISVALLHGRMSGAEKDRIMSAFVNAEIQLLVSTTVIEVGVDVPNAVIMVIENAERFGLSQLHQLRGRVGRGAHQSYCILISDSKAESNLSRLEVMKSTSDGFVISEEDLKLRGPGDFFGSRQHGLPALRIADMSADMEVLHSTQALAREILDADSNLSTDENAGLRKQVRALFAQGEEFGFN